MPDSHDHLELRKRSMRLLAIGCLAVLTSIAGCNNTIDPASAVAKANETNLQRLANLYFAYQMSNDTFHGPADEATFKQFIKEFDPEKLKRIGIDPGATDALFISDRDREPFKIRYGVVGGVMGCSEPVIFEAAGAEGVRAVGFLNMTQREVDEDEYESLWEGKTPPAPSGATRR